MASLYGVLVICCESDKIGVFEFRRNRIFLPFLVGFQGGDYWVHGPDVGTGLLLSFLGLSEFTLSASVCLGRHPDDFTKLLAKVTVTGESTL